MKAIHLTLLIGLSLVGSLAHAQLAHPRDPLSCTSIMVGRKASADGSVITSHTCDSWYRTWVNVPEARDYERDTITTIYDGLMHTEFAADRTGVKVKGEIPQVRHTYAFLNTSYPCINEKQLGMGESQRCSDEPCA